MTRERRSEHGGRPPRRAHRRPRADPQLLSSSAAKILIRADGAGATHGLLEHLEALNTTRRTVRYTVGWKITDADEQAIAQLPESAWETSLKQDGSLQGATSSPS